MKYFRDTEAEKRFQIVMLGDRYIGKSYLLSTFVGDSYEQTAGQLRTRYIEIDQEEYKLVLHDMWGDNAPITENNVLIKDAFLVCYDVTNTYSFEYAKTRIKEIKNHLQKLESRKQEPIKSIVLVGTKSDLTNKKAIDYNSAKEYADSQGISFIETSAVKYKNVDKAFSLPVEELLGKIKKKEYEEKTIEAKELGIEQFKMVIIQELDKYISRIASLKNYEEHLIFFSESRGRNRHTNYALAVELKRRLQLPSTDTNAINTVDDAKALFQNKRISDLRVREWEHLFGQSKEDHGLHSRQLNAIIQSAQEKAQNLSNKKPTKKTPIVNVSKVTETTPIVNVGKVTKPSFLDKKTTILTKLNNYIKDIEKNTVIKKGEKIINFESGFWFDSSRRASNRKANYNLAIELVNQLKTCGNDSAVNDLFKDDNIKAIRFNKSMKIFGTAGRRDDRGINSKKLNSILAQAKQSF